MKRLALLLPLLALVALPALAQDVPVPTSAPAVTAPHTPTLLELFLQYAAPPLLTALGGLAALALKKLNDYLSAKSTESKAAFVGAKLASAASTVVADLNVTLRPQLEAALADGVLTDAEKTKLKETALNTLKAKLPAELMGAAQGIFGAFLDTHLSGLVEQAVASQKVVARAAEDAAAVPPSP